LFENRPGAAQVNCAGVTEEKSLGHICASAGSCSTGQGTHRSQSYHASFQPVAGCCPQSCFLEYSAELRFVSRGVVAQYYLFAEPTSLTFRHSASWTCN